MRTKYLFLLMLLTLALVFSACAASEEPADTPPDDGAPAEDAAQDPALDEYYVLRYATTAPDEGDAINQERMKVFEDYITSASNGHITIEAYYGGVLGSDLDMLESMSIGSLESGGIEAASLASYSQLFDIFNVPYVFTDVDATIDMLNNGELGQMLEDAMAGTGIKFIGGWSYWGSRGLCNSKCEVQTVDDLKGMKIRVVESPVFISSFQAMGANPTPMDFTELFTGLQQKTVDGHDSDPVLTYSCKLYESQKYFTDINHIMKFAPFVISEVWYDSLPAEYQQVVADGAKAFVECNTRLYKEAEEEYLNLIAEAGLTVTRLTPEQRQTFIDAVAPIHEEYKGILGEEIFAALGL